MADAEAEAAEREAALREELARAQALVARDVSVAGPGGQGGCGTCGEVQRREEALRELLVQVQVGR